MTGHLGELSGWKISVTAPQNHSHTADELTEARGYWVTSPKSQSLKVSEQGLRPGRPKVTCSGIYAAVTGCPC